MKAYPQNSPEAMARILAMMMIADAKLDDREIEILDRLRIYDLLGISKNGFAQVVQDYCHELIQSSSKTGKIKLVERARIDSVIGAVDDHQKRVLICGVILNVANADGRIDDAEFAVLRYILERWDLSVDSLERELAAPKPPSAGSSQ